MITHLTAADLLRKKNLKVSSARIPILFCILVLLLPSVIGCRSKDVVARMGGQEITRDELESALKGMPERTRERIKDKVVNDLLEIKIFSKEARKSGLDKNPQVQEEIEKTANETLARLFIKKYLDKQATPSEKEQKSYYLEHKDTFVIPESVLVQHIEVQGFKRAEDLLKALKEGASFEDLAKQKSICHCWKKGGKHGWLLKGQMDPALEKAAFSLEKGSLSEIIKTAKGYQIVKMLDKKNKRLIPFEEARGGISSGLLWKKKNELIQKYYQKAKVNLHPSEEHLLAKIGEESLGSQIIAPFLSKASEKEKDLVREKWTHYLVETRVFSREAKKVHLEKAPEAAAELKMKTNQILANAFRKNFIIDNIKVSDQDIESYYQSHHEEFRVPVRLRVKVILVKTQGEAENLLKELKEGASFGNLAMKNSIHPSASKAGEIGWFVQGEKNRDRDPDLEKAALALEKGEMSGVIRTASGYEIIKLEDKKGGEIKPLQEVKQAVKMKLMMQRVEEEKQRYL